MVVLRAQSEVAIDRRAEPRMQVDCVAVLRTYSGNLHGTLWDLSLTGARFQAQDLPADGTTVLLEWKEFDAVARVIWVKERTCGLEFERPLHRRVVEASCSQAPLPPTQAAALGNIPQGKRRGLRELVNRSGT